MSIRVLIVDDSKLARMAISRTLSGLRPDWQRAEATNADEALALARQERFDVALVDFTMPGRDGLELAAEFRSLQPDAPVAVISANLQTEVIMRAEQVGAHFLPKPLTEKAMSAFIHQAEDRLGISRT